MNSYLLTIYFLLTAAVCQALIGAFALKSSMKRGLPTDRRRMWAAFSIGALLLALHHGYTLNLAAQTGLYDFRQATLAMLGALATTFAIWQIRRLLR